MEPDVSARMTALEEKIEKIYISVEKTRKYFFWTMVISIVVVVLPAIGLVFVIPYFLNSYVGGIQSLIQAN
jgi:type IV secretory pathway component VirB8